MKRFLFLIGAFFVLSITLSAQEAQVMAVSGKAEVQKGEEWVALAVGDKVGKGSVISTGFKSELLLRINSSNITMGSLTRLTIEQLLQNNSANKTSLFIDSGKVNVEVNKTSGKREDFKVSSPIATASVRGTSFTLFANGRLDTHTGLVSKGKRASSKASVSSEEDDEAFMSQEESEVTEAKASVFSATFAEGGTPVFAGQSSTTDTFTGQNISAQVAAAQNATIASSSTTSLASQESVSTASSAASSSSGDITTIDSTPISAPKSASLAVTITFPN